jgi:SecD/SecF fusion protein
MNLWIKSLLAGCIVAIPVYFLVGKIANRKEAVKYNIRYTIKAEPDKISSSPFSLSKVIQVLGKRLEVAMYQNEIKIIDNNTLQVSLSGIKDTVTPRAILTSNGKVQFRELYNQNELIPMLTAAIEVMAEMNPPPAKKTTVPEKRDSMSKKISDLLDSIELTEKIDAENTANSALIDFAYTAYNDPSTGAIVYPSSIGLVKLKDTASVRKIFASEKIKQTGPADMQVCFGEPIKKTKPQKEYWQTTLYFLKTYGSPEKALLENEDVSEAEQTYNQNGQAEIHLQFNNSGTRKWAAMTNSNIGRSIAIIINGNVISAPTVISPILDGSSSITGNYSVDEAQILCIGLRSTKLPANLTITTSSIKTEKSVAETKRKILMTLLSFVVSFGLALFVFKTLKST